MSDKPAAGTTGDSGQVAKAAAAAVAPDALTADLLAKHAAGQKLDPAGYGKIGAWKARAKAFLGGKSEPAAQPCPPRPGDAARLGAVAPGQAPGDSLPLVAPDAALCQRTTAALLRRIDAITVRWISHEAVKAGASAKILSEFQSSASLAAPDRELIAELSPDILVELGISPRQFPIVTAAAVVGLHSINLWQCVGELRDMQARVRAERLREEGGRPVTQPGPAIEQPPRPADPPGTMKVYCNESKNPPGPFDRPQSAEKAPG